MYIGLTQSILADIPGMTPEGSSSTDVSFNFEQSMVFLLKHQVDVGTGQF